MGTIVVHAGMPKAGSSAVQQMLSDNSEGFAAAGIVTAIAKHEENSGLVVRSTTERANNSVDIVLGLRDKQRRASTLATLAQQLPRIAAKHGTVVLTSEALAQPFWQNDRDFLSILNDLAATHAVRVAYYVRPQHSALEASWRQWGYRSGLPAGQYMKDRSRMMDYLGTADAVAESAPRVEFLVRPFRRDLLVGGDVTTDFLRTVLRTSAVQPTPVTANEGLPLDLVNLLALESSTSLWASEHENRRIGVLKQVVRDIEVPFGESLAASRALLQQLCHDRYEPANSELIARLGWATDEFVPATEVEVRDRTLDDFDELWRPKAESNAVEWLHSVLAATIELRQALTESERRVATVERRVTAATERADAAVVDLERLRDRRVVRAGLRLVRLVRPLVGRGR